MIATLTGKLKIKLNNQIVIDVNGVGYCLQVSKNTLDDIGEVDEIVILLFHQLPQYHPTCF